MSDLFDATSAHQLLELLKEEIDAPFVAGRVSTLGGALRAAVLLSFSLDPREEWTNGIFENSRFAKLAIGHDGEITLISDGGIKSSWRTPLLKKRWRKTTAKSFDDVVMKINKYIAEAK